jgi:hypothetical protein
MMESFWLEQGRMANRPREHPRGNATGLERILSTRRCRAWNGTTRKRVSPSKQVNIEVTLTYITSVTTTNPQIVRVEWSLSKQWSVVLLREENGTGGVDCSFKQRF